MLSGRRGFASKNNQLVSNTFSPKRPGMGFEPVYGCLTNCDWTHSERSLKLGAKYFLSLHILIGPGVALVVHGPLCLQSHSPPISNLTLLQSLYLLS